MVCAVCVLCVRVSGRVAACVVCVFPGPPALSRRWCTHERTAHSCAPPLQSEVSEMTERAATNQQLMMKIAQENKQLSEPLKSAVKKVESLQNDLKDAEKDKMSLKNAKARLRVMQRQIASLEREHKELERKCVPWGAHLLTRAHVVGEA